MLPKIPKPTLDPVSVGENIHVTGTGIPNYWIHMKYEKSGGGGSNEVFPIDGDGNFRSLNPILNVGIGDIITIAQSQHEYDDEDLWSDKVSYTVV